MVKLKINATSVGLALMCIYIFFSYTAVDIIMPSVINSISLYVFIAYGALVAVLSAARGRFALPVYSAWYLVFMIISLMTMVYSPEKSIFSGEFYLMIVSFVLTFLIQLFVQTERTFELICWGYSVSAASLNLMLIFTGKMTADASNRLGGDIFGNSNTFATMMMVAVMYTIWLLIYHKNSLFVKGLLLGMIVLDYYALTLSAGRKFFVIPVVFFYILLLFKVDKNGRRHFIRSTMVFLALSLLLGYLIMTVPMFYDTIGYRMESLVKGTLGIEEHGASAAIRELMRHIAVERWLERPFWGYGFDSFKYYCAMVTGHYFYSHCNYTELLYNGGIIYFAVYYWIYGRIYKNVVCCKQGDLKYRAFAIAVCVSFLIFDYGAVSYSMAPLQIMLALSMRTVFFNNTGYQTN